jgi:hypothetical protein
MDRHVRLSFATANIQHTFGSGFQVLQVEFYFFSHPGC